MIRQRGAFGILKVAKMLADRCRASHLQLQSLIPPLTKRR